MVGHEAAAVQHALSGHVGLTFVVQEPQLGTGHALLTTEPVLAGKNGTVVLLSGDAPLLKASTIRTLVDRHRTAKAAATVVTAVVEDSTGYGRIVRSGQNIARIVEERDASPTERQIREINSGIYAFELAGLFEAVRSIGVENAQRDITSRTWSRSSGRRGVTVETFCVPDSDEVRGINSRSELAAVSRIVREHKNDGADGGRGDDRGSGDRLHRRRRGDRRRHHPASRRVARRPDDHRRRLRDPQRRPHRQFADRRSGHGAAITA